MNALKRVFRWPHVEALVATIAGWLLIAAPGVGVIQAMMATALIVAVPRLWALSRSSAPRRGWRRVGLALAFLPMASFAPLLWWVLDSQRSTVVPGVEFAWTVVAVFASVAAIPSVLRGHASMRTFVVAGAAGLIATAIWVALGQGLRLDVRFHPLAVFAVASTTLPLIIARAWKSPNRRAVVACACFIIGQANGMFWYQMLANDNSRAQLGYLRSDTSLEFDGWKFSTETDGDVTTIRARRLVSQTRYVTTIYGPHTGLSLDHLGGVLKVSWFAPRDGTEHDCEGSTIRSVMFESQREVRGVSFPRY